MRKFITLCVVLLALMGWSTVGSADTGTVKILGDEQFVPNAMIMATFKFAPGPLSATSGASVTWDNTGSGLKYGEALPGEPERLGAGEKIPRVVASSEEPFSFERAFQVRGGKVRLN